VSLRGRDEARVIRHPSEQRPVFDIFRQDVFSAFPPALVSLFPRGDRGFGEPPSFVEDRLRQSKPMGPN